jgi:chromosomal replication initiation ATPase DnaA
MMAKKLGYTLTAIAKHLKKDHTTIVHYNKTFRNLMATSDLFNEKYNEVVVYIKSSK